MKKLSSFTLTFAVMLSFSVTQLKAKCLASWQYLMPISVTNNTSTGLSDYQVKVTLNTAQLVTDGKMISTGDDIRFVDANTCNTLNYWIESGMNTSTTVIWVKLTTLPSTANRTITMYYGNSSAAAVSNGDSTFLLFDDFNGTSLNTTKWATYNIGGSFTVSGGQISISAVSGAKNCATIQSKAAFAAPIILESSNTSVEGYYPSIAILDAGTYNGYALAYGDSTVPTGEMIMFKAFPRGGTYGGGQFQTNTNYGTLTGLWQLAWPDATDQSGKWPGGTISSNFNYVTPSSTVNVAAGMLYSGVGNITMDWIRVRTYAASEATTSNGQEASNHNSGINVPAFDNTLSIYPNPAHSFVNIDFNGSINDFETVALTDMSGKQIHRESIAGQTGVINLNVADLAKGIYLVKLTGKSAAVVQKLVIE